MHLYDNLTTALLRDPRAYLRLKEQLSPLSSRVLSWIETNETPASIIGRFARIFDTQELSGDELKEGRDQAKRCFFDCLREIRQTFEPLWQGARTKDPLTEDIVGWLRDSESPAEVVRRIERALDEDDENERPTAKPALKVFFDTLKRFRRR